jgi:hypothetical protein
MEYAWGSKQKEIMMSHPDITKARKDVVFVKSLSNGTKLIVHVVTINWEQGHFAVGECGRNTEKRP